MVNDLKQLGVRAIAVRADVTDPDAVTQMVEQAKDEFGRVDILVNDAAFNKELIEQLLEEQQASDQQNQDQQSQANNENQESDQSDDSQQDQSEQDQQAENQQQNQQDAEDEQQDSQGDQESQAQEDEAARDEKQEALEQWLRRVPDDPGGLLRRKFQHETKQRLRNGDYENRQGDKLW